MTMHELLFSNDPHKRVKRHLIFWSCWFIYMACTQVRNQSPDVIGMKNFIIYQLTVSLNRLMIQVIFCYIVVYFLVFHYLQKRKYGQFVFLFALFLFCMYWITFFDFAYLWYNTYVWLSRLFPFSSDYTIVKPLTTFLSKYYIIYSHVHFTGSLVCCGIILAVKYYKRWYVKQRENEMLLNENAQAELQLLKAQVHPHFLFNTLNNIYSLTLDDSQKAAIMVKKLAGMVFYMINEGAASFVPVSKEIKMLLDYIGLEKIRYGERLDIAIDVSNSCYDNRLIAPLLLIPFVENCFKHGASKIIDRAHIDLFIETENEWLIFKISNNQPVSHELSSTRKRIGLLNVQKRLQLLYPEKHLLEINSSVETFSVYMKVKLESLKLNSEQREPILSLHKMINHAL